MYLRFVDEHPNSPMVEQAEKARTAFAHKRLKASSVSGFRPDVMMYISEALRTFTKLGPQKRQEIGLEIARHKVVSAARRCGIALKQTYPKFVTLPNQPQ